MTTHVQTAKAGAASAFLAELAVMAMDGDCEHLHSGGSLPDVLLELKREGHLTDEMYISGCRFVHDITRCHGTSAGLVSRYGDQVDAGRGEWLPPRMGADIDAFNRIDRILSALWGHERDALSFCVTQRELRRGALADYGRQKSAFKTRQQSRAFAIGVILSLLSSVHEAYRLKVPIPS